MSPSARADSLHRALRAELSSFVRAAGARRVLPSTFHLGVPGGRPERDQIAIPEQPGYDAGLRADLVERCIEELIDLGVDRSGARLLLPWVTRSGDLTGYDADVAWAAAARDGFARHGLAFPGFYIITRRGWLDLTRSEITEERVRRRRQKPISRSLTCDG